MTYNIGDVVSIDVKPYIMPELFNDGVKNEWQVCGFFECGKVAYLVNIQTRKRIRLLIYFINFRYTKLQYLRSKKIDLIIDDSGDKKF